MTWPNTEVVNYCGEEIIGRICDEKSIRPNKNSGINVKICFTPKPDCMKEGSDDVFLVDHGESIS